MTVRALTFWDAARVDERERIRLILADALALYAAEPVKLQQFVHGMVVFNEPSRGTDGSLAARSSPP